ncbi:Ubiquitin carboxyl-terminal hydrolase 12 [Camellia lanceoleosa]|uniref:Ubiquitin carboxyl-terminal hydrolase 12 n=1 Tax=Camellia lanceoleosa TaxID=1840588 RepID=A0ACC0F1M0_9ERIC|nr:Ubiquitin carboxyl-terminal hydrolase 12 [Camellia lanceoleosa]
MKYPGMVGRDLCVLGSLRLKFGGACAIWPLWARKLHAGLQQRVKLIRILGRDGGLALSNIVEELFDRHVDFSDIFVTDKGSLMAERKDEIQTVHLNGNFIDGELHGIVPGGSRPTILVDRSFLMGSRFGKRQSDLFFEGRDAPPLSGRDAPPSHYSFKIQSFFSLSKASIEKYSSDKFEAGDYKWKLSIYPEGNKDRDGQGHVSISLTLVDTSSLLAGWEVKAIVNFFIFDQVGDMYHTLSAGNIRRFHAMQTEMGVPKFIDLEVFSDSSNGYLVNDTCVFGVDIFILKQTRKGEYLSVMKEIVTGSYIWNIKSFSALNLDRYESEAFPVEDHKWKIRIYPRGNGDGKGNSISMFLCLDETTLPPNTKLFVKFVLRVKSQNKSDDFEFKVENHFGPSCLAWGAQKFMSIVKLNDPKKGYLVGDTCIAEANVTLIGEVTTAS